MVSSASNVFSQPEWKKKYNSPATVQKMFAEPPMFYAPHAFWFWDDTLRNNQLPVSMVKEMAKQRLNPGYAHPRSSMDRLNPKFPSLPYSQYLEKPWFDNFGEAMQSAKAAGLTLGYCDEYDWPSGQAADRVLKQHPDLEAKYLVWKRYEVKGGSAVNYPAVDFAVAAKLSNGKIDASSLKVIEGSAGINWTAPAGDWVIYTYAKQFHAGIDGGKVNYLDPGLMKAFMPLVHDQYNANFQGEMGKTIPGVFVDNEGDYGWHMAWSDHLAEAYLKQKGRDIRLWLPLLTEKDNKGLYVKARFDWFDTVTDVYNECYFKPIAGWLSSKNMYYISNLWEESLQLQAGAVGDFMRITRTATMPGTDCLLMKSQDVHDFKETQTVAEFEDRPFMSEIMGVAGWGQSPQTMKMTLNSVTSFGVNHIVPHGIYLNRKPETYPFPADWYTENPYWPYLHQWTDFARRASFVTRQSKLVADVLLVNPQESIWANSEKLFDYNHPEDDGAWNEFAGRVEAQYSGAMRRMNENNLDFLIGDTYYLNKATLKVAGKQISLLINGHQFSSIVLPPMSVVSRPVANKLLEFAKKGGSVVLLGELPTGSPEVGEQDPVIIAAMQGLKNCTNVTDLSAAQNPSAQLPAALKSKLPHISLKNAGRLYTAHRQLGNIHLYWFANNESVEKTFVASVPQGTGGAEIWNCENGTVSPVEATTANGYRNVKLTLHPYEGYWLAFNPNSAIKVAPRTVKTLTRQLEGDWAISYPGVDTIFRTSASAFFSDDSAVKPALLTNRTVDPSWKRSSFIKGSLTRVVSTDGKDKRQELKSLGGKYAYWQLTIPAGAREVILPSAMQNAPIYLDGELLSKTAGAVALKNDARTLAFAINTDEQLPAQPIKFLMGNKVSRPLQSWFAYGLDEYTGYVDYEKEVVINKSSQKLCLDIAGVDYMAEVFVNGKSVGSRLWPPYKFNVPNELVKDGKNTIRIRVGNLMLNSMSMKNDLHQLRTWSWGMSPAPELDDYNTEIKGPVSLVFSK
ncbi:hypothetical protein BC343_08940 [Mucilaginibacter pedocola]|uniref:Glycosyl hydrolases family 2 sugar binding domain-containing protein n=2 Tax=Mucilaginibacter pedocola TaxID=1792845 RepID=A0A1S9PCV2_9SPHI|nr:hypothetical protein BC343_08940 [Mucilaginibacter pedocola]